MRASGSILVILNFGRFLGLAAGASPGGAAWKRHHKKDRQLYYREEIRLFESQKAEIVVRKKRGSKGRPS